MRNHRPLDWTDEGKLRLVSATGQPDNFFARPIKRPGGPEREEKSTMAIVTVLSGHVSQETAYVIDSYPYGRNVRCKMRVWLERTKHGVRFVSQTTNPKLSERSGVDVWNKPKASTYAEIMVMGLDEKGHMTHEIVSMGSGLERLRAFVATYGEHLTTADRKRAEALDVLFAAAGRVTWSVRTVTADEPRPSREEEQKQNREIMTRAIHQEIISRRTGS